jgi:hypothetical protein
MRLEPITTVSAASVTLGVSDESCSFGLAHALEAIPHDLLELLRFGIIPTILGVITRVVSIVRAAIPHGESDPETPSSPERIRRIAWPSA